VNNRRSVVVHGHFYQPPREDPWTRRVPLQSSAAPYHDWNERVHDECYRAVVAARVLDQRGRIAHVVNTLEWISWDAGPTLLEWLAREAPATYQAFLEADARARARTGHGNALATPYHHVILPLASWRDKVTEVRWGIADFRRRFRRDPEGMWLPEAAVDGETLEVLAREGIAFTVLGPSQVRRVPPRGLPGRVELSGGRSLVVFVYDGPLSHDVAFGELLRDSRAWLARLLDASAGKELLALATDGETFGHHHRWGEMALAGLLTAGVPRSDLRFEGFAAFLARHGARETVELVEPSSWSCVHGVERWRGDCGCKIDPSRPTSQAWRTELRAALDELGLELHARFRDEGERLFRDPWATRDAYGGVLDASEKMREAFLDAHLLPGTPSTKRRRALELLEMERDALRMMTSCAWFFDDVARLEPLQNLRYAAHALELAGEGAETLEARLLERLEKMVSNDPTRGTAAELWHDEVRSTAPRTAESVVVAGQGGETEVANRRAGVAEALRRAVDRALADPSAEAVAEALVTIRGANATDLFDAQTVLARALEARDEPQPHLAPLAARLGVAEERSEPGLPGAGPVRFVFGLHLHQPIGNFDSVFESHVERVYYPFLQRAADRDFMPMALHVSGPLLEWMEARAHRFLDLVARLVTEGRLELLLAGFYEPVLPALTSEDRLEQIEWMREWLRERLGATARGLWLTERVWEPSLARDLVDAGVEYVLTDDRHLVVAGLERWQLDRPWRTESEGRSLAVLPIDERLRYLVPFRSPAEIGRYLQRLAGAGRAVAVLADDGEKFGGWPGTAEWVWEGGWLDAFLDEMERLTAGGVVRLARPGDVVSEVPAAGLAYPPTASYHEMELWSLPPAAAERLERARAALAGEPGARDVVRGGHWRNFLGRYEESKRMHAKALRLSEICRRRGNPAPARRAIGKAQCNDAYWHGVFGGIYLRHLRAAIWENLAEAERLLREGEPLEAEWVDMDGDGEPEIWVHSAAISAVVRPHRGGALTELTHLEPGVNLADVLTRRRESYHRTVRKEGGSEPESSRPPEPGQAASIHELEDLFRVEVLPPVDLDPRALFLDRMLPASLDEASYAAAEYVPVWSWAGERFQARVATAEGAVRVELSARGRHRLEKVIEFGASGAVSATYRWDPAAFPRDARFAPELSLALDPGIEFDPVPGGVWRYEIVTVSKRESGLEETVQGTSLTPLWPATLGCARIVVAPAPRTREPSADG
jgi:alpha-amylase/alpha-mannosidase (GH57 family)